MNKEHQIKCYRCKKYYDIVTIFTKEEEKYYKTEKWFCDKCFNLECYYQGLEQGKLQAQKDILEIIEGTKAYNIVDLSLAKHLKAIDFKRKIIKKIQALNKQEETK